MSGSLGLRIERQRQAATVAPPSGPRQWRDRRGQPTRWLALQRTAGNRAVASVLGSGSP
jgi:hypothetical protein